MPSFQFYFFYRLDSSLLKLFFNFYFVPRLYFFKEIPVKQKIKKTLALWIFGPLLLKGELRLFSRMLNAD